MLVKPNYGSAGLDIHPNGSFQFFHAKNICTQPCLYSVVGGGEAHWYSILWFTSPSRLMPSYYGSWLNVEAVYKHSHSSDTLKGSSRPSSLATAVTAFPFNKCFE